MKKQQLAAILIICVAGVAAPLHGAPIAGTLEGDITLTPTGTPGVYSQTFTGDGDDITYGSFTPSSTSTADFSHPPKVLISSGMLSETFDDGTLLGTSSGDGTANGSGTATVTIDFAITGGTGLFAGASGDVTVTGTITATSPTTESFKGTYVGRLQTVPDRPTTCFLLLLAVGAILLAHGGKAPRSSASNLD